MVFQQEVGRVNRGFPYGEGIIMKTGCDVPLCNLEVNSETFGEDENDSQNVELEKSLIENVPHDELEKAQDLRMYYENSISYTQNPQHIMKDCMKSEDPYDEDMAEVKYLYSKPVAFIIVGKPSLDNMKLGQKLAAYWGCLYIDPITCFDADPDSAVSPAMLWCQKYLSEGRIIPSEMVMRVMEQRALSDEAMHRGFVICGLPFIQQNGESSAQEQMHMIFSWPFEPKIFIYVTCPDVDVITKSKQMYYDTTTGNYINKNVFSIHKELLLVYSHEPRISTIGTVTDDVYKETEQEKKLVAEKDVNHLVVMPEPNLEYIILRYQQAALLPVELYVAQVHPQHVIRVDGRTTLAHMLRTVKARLETLPLQPVCQAVPMFKVKKQQDKEQTGDETVETEREFEELEGEEEEEEEGGMEGEEDEFPLDFSTLDEAYQELCTKDVVGTRFKWQKSNWKFLCPVSLSSGKIVEGEAKYSARFLNKIYFLSSPEALNAFLKNPRPYLLPPNPRPCCKFIVIGHEYAGKSTVATYLSRVYQGKVIHFSTYVEEEQEERKRKKVEDARETAIKTKMNEINQERQKEYKEAEKKRNEDIKVWQKENLDAITNLVPKYDMEKEVLDDMFPDISEDEVRTQPTIDFSQPLLPQISYARCRWLSKHPDELLKYLPPHLAFPTPLPRAITESDPSVQKYVKTAVKYAMEEKDPESISEKEGEILVQGIREAQNEFQIHTGGQKLDGGWVIDDLPLQPEIWGSLTNEGITPEVVISLQDLSPEYGFLKQKKLAHLLEKSLLSAVQIQRKDEEKEDKRKYEEQTSLPKLGPDSKEITEYAKQLTQFDAKWTALQESISPFHPLIIIDVANKQLSDLVVEVGQRVQALYNVSAEPFTDEDRDEERNLGQNLEEMETEEEEEEQIDEENEEILKNRRMGETMIYCPVAYGTNNVLWKGKHDLLAKYKGKVYSFSNEEAMEKFMDKPWNFVKRHRPENFLPPLRICIVGPVGSGKTAVGKLLARSLGLFHTDFALEINHTLIPKCKPLGRKEQYLGGRYIKDEPQVKRSGEAKGESRESEDRQSQNELEDEISTADAENRMLRDALEYYLTDGTPMPEMLTSKLLTPLWQNEKYQCNGFVLSGFPWHPEDIDVMKAHYLIPDVIICLSIPNDELAATRLLKEMKEFDERKIAEQNRKAEKEQTRQQAALAFAEDEYGESSLKLEFQNLLLTHLQHAVSDKSEQVPEDKVDEEEEEEYDGEAEEEEEFEDILGMQYKEDIQEWFASDMEKLETIKTLAEEQGINWLDINAGNEMHDVCLRIVHEIHPLKLRSSSTFEKTFPITSEEAEQLLQSGYYFLSRFGRWCPVQLAVREIPIQLFTPMNQKAQIFPVIHRQYIYFLGGQENLALFQKDPMKYISNTQLLPMIPVKIAIIGPPKSGKSVLAKRLSKELNVKIITIGQAIRYVLDDLNWTELALSVGDLLREGETIPVKMAMRCVEAATMDPRSTAQGYVFDGFPITNDQINEMASLNLFPYLIISLDCTLFTCISRLQSEDKTFFSRTPIFSSKLLQHKYNCWYQAGNEVKRQLNAEYHNLKTLEANHDVWWLYDKTTDHLFSVMKSISDYYRDITSGKPGKLESMCITPDEFKNRQSKYLHFCPGCLQEGHLNSGGVPPDKMGLVQQKVHYYWFCETHLPDFLEKPIEFLPPANKAELPDDLPYIPAREDNVVIEIANDGYCIVSYTDSMQERLLIKGTPEYSVIYKKKKYLFASAAQRNKFLSNPNSYTDQKMCRLPLRMPTMNVLRFPTLGFLEQTVSAHIHSALLQVGSERPKYPGLPLDISAAIYLGYHLKLTNPGTSPAQMEMLSTAQEEFLLRCNLLKKLCNKTKICNPLLCSKVGMESKINIDAKEMV